MKSCFPIVTSLLLVGSLSGLLNLQVFGAPATWSQEPSEPKLVHRWQQSRTTATTTRREANQLDNNSDLVASNKPSSYQNINGSASQNVTSSSDTAGNTTASAQDTDRRQQQNDEYLVGMGLADITGPAADINLMGYAKPNQDSSGIHLRQFSRAVVIEDKWGHRMVYVSLDSGMISTLLRVRVLDELKQVYGSELYTSSNVMLSATHTHSGPGGFFQYMLYNIPSAGFISQTLEALVSGTVKSIERAHDSMRRANIYYNQGHLLGASVNRSPKSYANNPESERKLYSYDTDKTMHLLKFVDLQGETIGILNWFAVHGTSMNNTNHLISSDNKGYAALLFEQEMNPKGSLPGKGKFVAIFAQANEGDVSPNTAGPRCVDTGLPCDSITSTCGNPPKNEKCIAFGPGKDMFESTKIIAHKQFSKALELYNNKTTHIKIYGPVGSILEHIDMTSQEVPLYEAALNLANRSLNPEQGLPRIGLNETFKTCRAALGYSFAAGTTDGPGAFDFYQSQRDGKSYWNLVRDCLHRPSAEQVACHHPKPILLNTGQMDFPYTWHPKVVPTQLFQLGQLIIVALPGEFTTMSGRRVRAALKPYFPGKQIILSGLSNIYTSYVTTIEEYSIQRYEGASTLYGPHTLEAYINQFRRLAAHLSSNQTIEDSLSPPDLTKSLFSLRPGVWYDGASKGHSFGDTLVDVDTSKAYQCGQLVNVTFVSANPRNNLRLEDTFLRVDRLLEDGAIEIVATDASWETKFIWERTNTLWGESKATIIWEIPQQCEPGNYIIRHFNSRKSLLSSTPTAFAGQSSVFEVVVPNGKHVE